MSTCAHCRVECKKRNIVCVDCWEILSQTRKTAIRMAPYQRGELGKKFITDLLICDEEILRSMIAENNVQFERYGELTKNVKFIVATELETQKQQDSIEIV